MGGIGIGVELQRIAGNTTAGTVEEAAALREAFWEQASRIMWGKLGRGGNHSALEYASDQVYDHARDDAAVGSVDFTFMDCAGCCSRSMYAVVHWMNLAFALEREKFAAIAARSGYQLAGERPSVASMVRRGSSTPLFHAGGKLWAISRRQPGQPLKDGDGMIFGDSEQIEPSALSDKDREVASRISLTGRCHCELCSHARKTVKPKKPRGQKVDDPFDDKALDVNVARCEELLANDATAKGLVDAALPKVTSWSDADWAAAPGGPPEMQVLVDWLETKSARIATIALTGILFQLQSHRDRGY
jgi:hypothetical protein